MRVETETRLLHYGVNWKPDPSTRVTVEMPEEQVLKFLEMYKAFGRRVYEDETKYWTIEQRAYDEIHVSTYWKE